MLLHNTFLLTLSQFEPQIYLKSNLLIFVIKVRGIISGNIDALYIIHGIIKLFTIVILPIKVRLREDHKLNKGSKFNFSSVFALSQHCLIGIKTHKYLKVSIGHFKPLSVKGLFYSISVTADVESLTFRQICFTIAVIGKLQQNSKYTRKLIISAR